MSGSQRDNDSAGIRIVGDARRTIECLKEIEALGDWLTEPWEEDDEPQADFGTDSHPLAATSGA